MAAARAKRARMDNDERRAQLLALALGVFSTRAYDEVSMDDLARAAGISKGLVYHYFPTKRHFYVAALREAARQLVAETETDDADPPDERLKKGLEAYLSFVEKHARAYSTLMHGGVGVDKQVSGIVEKTRAIFVDRLLAAPEVAPHASRAPALRLALRGWVGFVEATALEWIDRREIARDALVTLWITALFATTGLIGDGAGR